METDSGRVITRSLALFTKQEIRLITRTAWRHPVLRFLRLRPLSTIHIKCQDEKYQCFIFASWDGHTVYIYVCGYELLYAQVDSFYVAEQSYEATQMIAREIMESSPLSSMCKYNPFDNMLVIFKRMRKGSLWKPHR